MKQNKENAHLLHTVEEIEHTLKTKFRDSGDGVFILIKQLKGQVPEELLRNIEYLGHLAWRTTDPEFKLRNAEGICELADRTLQQVRDLSPPEKILKEGSDSFDLGKAHKVFFLGGVMSGMMVAVTALMFLLFPHKDRIIEAYFDTPSTQEQQKNVSNLEESKWDWDYGEYSWDWDVGQYDSTEIGMINHEQNHEN